ncbi:interleukin-17B isoform X1 [Balaenoptera acutorostrata]|uniref:Interleukin-17B isoform X1 n=1 Tax=Balaenoptera acutorostrata TaxID=9767 RepID=A0ABM3T5J4_BALAC|nr:interleukin-17B isoform X1 [Balaenoptera acutorostrata]
MHLYTCGGLVAPGQGMTGEPGPARGLASSFPLPWAPSLSPEGDLALPPLTCGLPPQLFLLTISIFLGLGQPRNPKGKRKGQGRPGTLAPGPHQVPLDLVSRAKPYARMEEYERNLGEMVAQLRNSSEPARRKCEVNLQLWLSNKRSLSPWGYSINHDPSRIPADLPEARCLCLGCVNPFTMQEDRSMVSVPVFSQVPVRRRLCPLPPRTGPCRQRAVMETIAVGCTCIF